MRRVAVVVLCAAVLAGCTGGSAGLGDTGHHKEVTTEGKDVGAARRAAQYVFNSYASGDWAGAWDAFDSAGQKAISRENYVKLRTQCKTITGVPFVIKSIHLDSPTKATVETTRASFSATYTMVYERGHWRYHPDAESMASYAKGLKAAVAEAKATGQCQ